MANAGSPLRLDAELIRSASLVAPLMHRSVAQQVAHWAHLGRELEAHGDISLARIAAVLRGKRRYDELSAEEQAMTKTEWARRVESLRRVLRLDEFFAAGGRRYAELDASGRVVVRTPRRRNGARRRAGR